MKQNNVFEILIPYSLYDAMHIDWRKWGIIKFFTLMLEGPFEQVMECKCNTNIILGCLHSPWSLRGYCIALLKPKSNTILAPYCDNILNHGMNKGIVKLVTLMVKGNETIIKMREL
jgi:hypothetical protein